MKERRVHVRAPISPIVQVRFTDLQEFVGVHAANVSAGGMFLATKNPRPEGTLLELQFVLKDGQQLIKGEGKVVWVQTAERASEEEPEGMGISFLSLEEPGPELIDRVIQDYVGKKE